MLYKIYNKWIPEQLKEDVLIFSSAKNIISTTLIAIFAVPGYALIYYFLNYPLATYVILLLGVVFFCSVLILKFSGSLFLSGELFVGALFLCLIWLSYTFGGLTSSATFWLILPPFLAIKFGSIKSGFFWGFCGVVIVLILYLLEIMHIPLPPSPISNELVLRVTSIAGLITIVLMLAYFFEVGKREAAFQLEISKSQSEYFAEIAQESNRLKMEFLENMSHELRTPLNSISGFAELMLEGKVSSEDTKEFNKNIVVSSRVLKEMIENMLDISKFELVKMVFFPVPVDIRAIVNEIKNMLNVQISEKKLKFDVKIDSTIKKIMTDPLRLRQVFLNYISNAIKFTPKGGKIDVRIYRNEKDQIRIEVEDTGIGISKEDIDKLFHPFQQLDTGITKKYQGAGIGLALVRRIVEGQGGSVGVKSTLGKGSIFSVTLPGEEGSNATI